MILSAKHEGLSKVQYAAEPGDWRDTYSYRFLRHEYYIVSLHNLLNAKADLIRKVGKHHGQWIQFIRGLVCVLCHCLLRHRFITGPVLNIEKYVHVGNGNVGCSCTLTNEYRGMGQGSQSTIYDQVRVR